MTRSSHSILTFIVLALVLASGAVGQTQFDLWGPKAHFPANEGYTPVIVAGDLDGDGDADMATVDITRASSVVRIYMNDGTGRYSEALQSRIPQRKDVINMIALGDIEGDGDLDLVIATKGQNLLYLNDGTGRFVSATTGRIPADSDATEALEFADLDEDGDLDLVVCNIISSFINNPQTERIYQNDGTGRFTDVSTRLFDPLSRMWLRSHGGFTLVIDDLDGDDDLDLFFGGRVCDLLVNQARQLTAPLLAMVGREYRLDVYARYGAPYTADKALIVVAARRANSPMGSLGTLGLDPKSMVPFPIMTIPQPLGLASVSVTIPNTPALVGGTFHAQAVIMRGSGSTKLTNVVTDSISR